ncbi:MAG: cyclic nucleotide-binding domain-containing protein [Archangium sp.]
MSTPVVRVELKRANAAEVVASDVELRELPVVKALGAGRLAEAVLRRFAPQSVLWQQGDEGQSLLLVVAGAARVLARRDKDNAEIATARKGEVLGESEWLHVTRRKYSVVAQQQLDVIELMPSDIGPELKAELLAVEAIRGKALDELSDFLNRW